MPKLRLLKVIVQPVFVVDEGDALREITADAVAVPAKDWPDYPATQFQAAFEQLRSQIEQGET